MKYKFLILICLCFSLLSSSCEKPTEDGGSVSGKGNIVGYVRNSTTGAAIAGVAVSDGYSYAKTDKNGRYAIEGNTKARCVSIVVPSGYKIPLSEDGMYPCIYAPVDISDGKTATNDFALEPLESQEKDFTIVALGDIHCKDATWTGYFQNETLPDVKKTLEANQPKGRFTNSYIFTVGDLMHYFSAEAYTLDDVKKVAVNQTVSTQKAPVAFFNCIGNHDQDPWVKGYATDEDYLSEGPWVEHFGPNNYAIDRGGVHIVVLDDVVAWGNSSDTGGAGKNVNCMLGLNIKLLKWLKDDFSMVSKPSSKTLVVICHIPFGPAIASGDGTSTGVSAALKLMQQFKDVHIISGHVHNPYSYEFKDYKTAGGKPIYEHNLRSVCGNNWRSRICSSGAPNSYTLFEFSNGEMTGFTDKAVGKELGDVMSVYDGNATYTGGYMWYNGSVENKQNTLAGKMVVSIPGAYPDDWTVRLVSNGTSTTMTKVSDNQTNWCTYAFWKTLNVTAGGGYLTFWTTDVPSGVSALGDWKVEAVHTNPVTGVKTTYECNKLTTDFTGFAR